MAGLLNDGILNTGPLNAGTGSLASSRQSAGGYRVELRSGFLTGNQLVAILDKYLDGATWKRAVNEPSTLSLSYPESYSFIPYLRRPYEIHIFDREGSISESFIICSVTRKSENGKRVVDIECKNYLGYLNEYVVAAIDSPPANSPDGPLKTVQQIIDEILAYTDSRLGASAIDPAIAARQIAISFRSCTCMEALTRLYEAVGSVGYYWVHRYGMYWSSGYSAASYYVNENKIATWDDALDYESCVTRLYAYSRGNDADSRITLRDAGQEHEYLESDNIGIYGETEAVVEYDVKDAASLLVSARADLEKLNAPIRTFRAVIYDSYYSVSEEHVSPLNLADTIRVDRDGDPAVLAMVTSIETDIGNPSMSRITIANRERTAYSLIADSIVLAKKGEAKELFGSKDPDMLPDSFRDGAPEPTEEGQPAAGSAWPGESDLAAREDHGPHLDQEAIQEIVEDSLFMVVYRPYEP